MNSVVTPSSRLARLVVAVFLLLVCLGGAVWALLLFSAEYQFRTMRLGNLEQGLTGAENETRQLLNQYETGLRELLRLDPTNGEIRNRYASVLGMLGRYDPAYYEQAIQQLEVARLTHNAQNSLFFLADMHEKAGRVDEAETLMGDVVRLNPTNISFNSAWLRLLNKKVLELKSLRDKSQGPEKAEIAREYEAALRVYNQAARAWAVRAHFDPNAYLFLGNALIEPLNAKLAYFSYLMGLALFDLQGLRPQDLMIPTENVLGTIKQIFRGHAKPYRDLP